MSLSNSMRHRAVSLVELLVVLAIIGILLALIMSGIAVVRGQAARVQCSSKLQQIGLGAQAHHSQHGYFPIGLKHDEAETPRMSWLVQLLPYMDQQAAWQQALASYAEYSNPFYNPPHILFATPMPMYVCPLDVRGLSRQASRGRWVALTSYLGNYGINVRQPDGMLIYKYAIRINQVQDGTSQTLFAGERPPSKDMWFGWWYTSGGQLDTGNADVTLGVREINVRRTFTEHCPPGPYDFGPGRIDEQCDLFHFWSPHPDGAHFAFTDGSARFLRYTANDILPALATRAGGESVDVP